MEADSGGRDAMTIKKIASALMLPDFKACSLTIIPPWCEGVTEEEAKAKDAWRTVRTLRSQHDELIVIFPHKKAKLDEEFNAELLNQARSVHETLFELTP